MASINDPDMLNAAFEGVHNLEESLLTGLELTHHGYSAELRFAHLLRGKPVPETSLVTVVMEAVSLLRLTGGLTDAMVKDPERISWGLSEVAMVSAYATDSGVGLLVAWEDPTNARSAWRRHGLSSTLPPTDRNALTCRPAGAPRHAAPPCRVARPLSA